MRVIADDEIKGYGRKVKEGPDYEPYIKEIKEFISSDYRFCEFEARNSKDYEVTISTYKARYMNSLEKPEIVEYMKSSGIKMIRLAVRGEKLLGEKVYVGEDGDFVLGSKRINYEPYIEELIRAVDTAKFEHNSSYSFESLQYMGENSLEIERNRYRRACEDERVIEKLKRKNIRDARVWRDPENFTGIVLEMWRG